MEAFTEYGEIKKCLKIEKFSTYKDKDDTIFTVIPVIVQSFRSEWKVIVYPMHPSQPQETSPVHCDVVVKLVCLHSSAPPSVIQNMKIVTSVHGRENYSQALHPVENRDYPTWKGVIISRVIFFTKRNHNDSFEFIIKFIIDKEILYKSEDSKIAVVKNLETILKDPQYFDTCLFSRTGVKFYAHSPVLKARSNIMETGKVLTVPHNQECDELFENSEDEEILSSQDSFGKLSKHDKCIIALESGTDDSSDPSSVLECNQSSPFKNNTPLFTFSSSPSMNPMFKKPDYALTEPSSPCKCVRWNSPQPTVSPMKRHLSYASPSALKRKSTRNASTTTSKGIQTQITNFLHCSSKQDTETKCEPCEVSAGLTCSTTPVISQTHSWQSPSEGHKAKASSPLVKIYSKETGTPSSLGSLGVSPNSLQMGSSIKSLSVAVVKQNFQNSRRKLFDGDTEEKNITILELNMSTSVLQELLCWIYTGESARLQELCRPLLVAALRHSVEDLARAAQLHLASRLTINNASDILFLSHKYEAKLLEEEAMKFALCHARDITSKNAWTLLSRRCPQILLIFTKRLADMKS